MPRHMLVHTHYYPCHASREVSRSESCNRWSHCGWHDGRDTPALGTCMQRGKWYTLSKGYSPISNGRQVKSDHHIRVGEGMETTGLGGVIGDGPMRLLARSQGPCSMGFDRSIDMKALAGGDSEMKNDAAMGAGTSALRMDRTGARLGTGGCGRTCLGVSR